MGSGNQPNYGQMGAQSPTLDPNSSVAKRAGIAYEVFSINEQGQRKRHQVWEDKAKAMDLLKRLKKLYGDDIKAGIREVRDMTGNLYSQSVSKCRALLKAANQPPVAGKTVGIVTAHGKVMTGKSPKVSGHISAKAKIGTTSSGKAIHNDPGHKDHASFGSSDHMDAYRAHAKALSTLDPKETHPSIIEHHKSALNAHYKMGVSGVKKSFAEAVSKCLLLKSELASHVKKVALAHPGESHIAMEHHEGDGHVVSFSGGSRYHIPKSGKIKQLRGPKKGR